MIGILASANPINPQNLADFRKGLSDAGYVEGSAIEVSAAERYEQLPALAADLVRQRVAVIVADALPAALAAKMATTTIPIVFFTGDDPVRAGLVTTLNRRTRQRPRSATRTRLAPHRSASRKASGVPR